MYHISNVLSQNICGGGDSFEKSLSLFLRPSGDLAMWQCFRDKCAWRGHVEAIEAERTSYGQFNYTAKVEPSKSITKASMGLEPPCQKALSMPSAFMSQDQEHQEIDMLDSTGLISLKQKLEKHGIHCATCKPGEYNHLICPECGGGDSLEKSFSLFINPVGDLAMWQCFREECGRRGHVRSALYDQFECTPDVEPIRYITEESIGLEPLCEELIAYFSKRMITRETLRRNAVMQKAGKQLTIAFTYRRNGVLTSCKYRQINKRFRQERGTEKILYGLDDIKQAIDIIIVEGEMDKLSMEEAGFCNCVSVPDGAPTKVSTKDLLCAEQDTGFQYLWNCKEYFEKASRIILATDADPPGQVLAEELARRLGRERCWRVKWPKKNEVDVCKDANEVLMYLGHHALRTMIDEAKSYPTV
ncbi:hypothetical protein GIB67_027727 [Kingdonia uniflora]|uniref:Toprim domain-containing protein n=1 Tax=Kingdonia uniflora TaxID=39325 RepID=A0A7J7PBW2_9MAGN|nr:hypothetical protein GIB67_027727 [Kingdonia uniflora]